MEITYFKLADCPYCRQADKWLNELREANPEFAKIIITEIDEKESPDIADDYDYYYVPTLFMGCTKLHEGAATKEKLKKVLNNVVEANKRAKNLNNVVDEDNREKATR